MGSFFSSILKPSRDLRDKAIFHPPGSVDTDNYPRELSVEMIKSSGGNIEVVYCRKRSNKCIVFSHGNAGCNYGYSSFLIQLSNALDATVVGYDYQGYSNSEGTYSEGNCYADLEATVEWTKSRFGALPSQIFLMGQSLGTGITADYAANHVWLTPIILISPYKSIINVVCNDAITFTSSSLNAFETKKKLPLIECPIKIFHGLNDEVIDVSHSRSLFENMKNKKYAPTYIPNCGHNDILNKMDCELISEILHDK